MNKSNSGHGYRITDLPLYYLLYLVSLLPFGVIYVLSDGLSWLFWNVIKYRKKVVLSNLRASFPEKSEQEIQHIGREFYRNLTDIIFETVKLTSISTRELAKHIEVQHHQVLIDAVAEGKSFEILASHHCNWEWIFAVGPGAYKLPIHGVYKPLSNRFFETYLRHIRTRLGGELIKMKDTMRHLVATRKQAKAISMVADQTPPYSEIQHWTNFLNQETAFYSGADKIARTFNYPVYFVHSRRTGRGRYFLKVERIDDQAQPFAEAGSNFPIIDVYARKLEELIRSQPEAYLWSHRRWKHKRPVSETVQEAAGINK